MRSSAIILAAVLALAGCAAEKQWLRKPSGYGGAGAAGQPCPNQIPGTTVRLENLGQQSAMVFEAGGEPTALRDAVQRFADDHNRALAAHQREAVGTTGEQTMKSGSPGEYTEENPAPPSSPLIPARASVQPTPGGARIVYTPVDSSDLPLVQQKVADQAVRMANGECPRPQ